ncbi:MAG TPA: YceI family protein [Acidimicrobiales bacterium]|nr:YceI family protein [Acidimicrobiales bacterium]
MPVPHPGDHVIGPTTGRLRLRTYRQGVAARAGHDLVLWVSEWSGSVHVPPDGAAAISIEVEIDLRTLEVLEGTGGLKPLSAGDRADIVKAMQKPLRTDAHPLARFTSSEVRVDGDRATIVGDLALAGESHQLELAVHLTDGGTLSGRAQVVQTTWGIKPYTGFFGALKLRDAVDVELEVDGLVS